MSDQTTRCPVCRTHLRLSVDPESLPGAAGPSPEKWDDRNDILVRLRELEVRVGALAIRASRNEQGPLPGIHEAWKHNPVPVTVPPDGIEYLLSHTWTDRSVDHPKLYICQLWVSSRDRPNAAATWYISLAGTRATSGSSQG
jgi:hypothetical protein